MNRPSVLVNLALPETGPTALAAAAAGFDGVGLADSPALYPDCFIETERVLTGSDLAFAGPCVLALGLRHPVTVASALAALARRHGGRLLAVVGRGESAVRNAGLPVPGLRSYDQLLAGLATACEELGVPRPAGAASGPRTIALTAARCGEVLIDAGVRASVVAAAVRVAREANPRVRCRLFVRAVPTGSPEQERAATDPILGSCAARLAAAPSWYGLDPDEAGPVRALAESYDHRRHGRSGGPPVPPEVAAAVRDRFVLTGADDRIAARVSELTRLGVDGFVLAGALPGVHDHLAGLGATFARGIAAA
jgi:alkanesulfonate monooxygenase SsuD/methylene tetrahydromethanopterin reductase-like flavin-dependent oxidoreductase (luciferase family)